MKDVFAEDGEVKRIAHTSGIPCFRKLSFHILQRHSP
jgi:hypothetical protein